MPNWRDMAAAATAAQAESSPAPNTFGLSPDLARAVERLGSLPPPRALAIRAAWAQVTSDAQRIAREGWAAKALALGWSPHDIFGVGPRSSDTFEGLAVWLAGRSIAALAEWQTRTSCGALFYRDEYLRPSSPKVKPVFLWDFGRS